MGQANRKSSNTTASNKLPGLSVNGTWRVGKVVTNLCKSIRVPLTVLQTRRWYPGWKHALVSCAGATVATAAQSPENYIYTTPQRRVV